MKTILRALRDCTTSVALVATMSVAGYAQSKPIEFITAVPDAPAFTFLSATPKQIERPGSLRDLGVAIQNGVGADGKAKSGFALDASIWNLIPGFAVPLSAYQSSFVKFALANTQLSIATLQATGDTTTLLAALGLRTVFYDDGDPMRSTDVTRNLAAALRACAPDEPGGSAAACVDSVASSVIGEFTKSRWNSTQLAFAAAIGSRFANGEIGKGSASGFEMWLTGSTGLGTKFFQIIGQATYKNREAVDTIPSYTAINAGARIVVGAATYATFLEFGREWRSLDSDPTTLAIKKDVGGWSAGVEFRIAANMWISTGLGTRYEALDKPDGTHMFAGLKWGVTSKSRVESLK